MWIYLIMYILLIPCAALFIRTKHTHEGEILPAAAIKAACMAVIIVPAVISVADSPEHTRIYAILIASGLVFGVIGDVLICVEGSEGFWFGMFYFGVGHLFYIAAFLRVTKHGLWAIPAFIIIYILFILFAVKLIIRPRRMPDGNTVSGRLILITGFVYSLIITCMLSLALTIPCSVPRGSVVCMGAVLFVISDATLAYGKLEKPKGTALDTFSLSCYFFGQSLLGLSIWCLR